MLQPPLSISAYCSILSRLNTNKHITIINSIMFYRPIKVLDLILNSRKDY